jgi:hypothetical protein
MTEQKVVALLARTTPSQHRQHQSRPEATPQRQNTLIFHDLRKCILSIWKRVGDMKVAEKKPYTRVAKHRCRVADDADDDDADDAAADDDDVDDDEGASS